MKLFNSTYYHGSGVKFDKFDFNFMSTGEGHQVHGWGIYLAEDEQIAQEYRDSVTGSFDVIHINWNDGQETVINSEDLDVLNTTKYWNCICDVLLCSDFYDYKDTYSVQDWKDEFYNLTDNLTNYIGYSESVIKEAYENFDNITNISFEDRRYGMVATVHVDDDCVFAREDLLLTEQNESVKTIMNGLFDDLDDWEGCTFGEWYIDMTCEYVGQDRDLSMKLLENGIDGISYNGCVDGECLVLFNIDKCKIIEKD